MRKELDISQSALGKILGVTGAAISNYENDRRDISAADFQVIVNYYQDQKNNQQ